MSFETDAGTYRFSDEALLRAAVKYGRALAHCEVMARRIGAAAAGRPFEIEVSIDETEYHHRRWTICTSRWSCAAAA
jgi:hypothetical protein